jgi:3-hydroxybutyryl-CoA dehydratase
MNFEDLQLGQSAHFTKTITETDVILYAGITGDLNPAHIDQTYAEQSRFGGRIAHGMLTAGLISATLAMKLPGPGSIYLTQSLRFTKPVRIGDTVTARVEVLELIPAKRRARLSTKCTNQHGDALLDGEALVWLPDEPATIAGAPSVTP